MIRKWLNFKIILKIVCLLSFTLGRISGFNSIWMQNRHHPLSVSTSHSHHAQFPNHLVQPSNQLYWYWYYNYLKGLAKNGNEGEATKYAQVGDQIIECDTCQTCEGCYGFCPKQVKTVDGTKTVRLKRIEDSLFYFADDISTEKVGWAQAEQKCKDWFGAHLASIHSAEEEEKIRETLLNEVKTWQDYSFGGEGNHEVMKWNDGSPWDHTLTWGADSNKLVYSQPGWRYLVYSQQWDAYGRVPIDRPQLFVCRIYCN